MAIKIISLSILLTLLMILIRADCEKEDAKFEQCQVFSAKYRRYMYARRVKMWSERERRVHAENYQQSFLDAILFRDYKIEYSERNLNGVWAFEPVIDRKGAYYLRNLEYRDHYLKGTSSYLEGMNSEETFFVWAGKKNKYIDEEFFMWRFNQTSKNSDRYYIWNVKNGCPLYTRIYNYFMISLFKGSGGKESEWEGFEWNNYPFLIRISCNFFYENLLINIRCNRDFFEIRQNSKAFIIYKLRF